SDIPDTPPSVTHGTPFTETTLSTQRSPSAYGSFRCRVMVLAPGQPIPHGRSYRYHLNGPTHMMTARKRVGPLPTHRLAVRHSVDYSSSDHFASDDSSRDSSSSLSLSSSSETSFDPSADDLSVHSLPAPSSSMRPSHHVCLLVSSIPRSYAAITDRPYHDSSSASPSHKRSRSHTAYVPLSLPILGALSYTHGDLLPSPKRIRSSNYMTDLEDSSADRLELSRSRETELEIDVDVMRSDGIDIDPKIQAEIDECIAYADALRDRGIDARVVVEAVDQDEIETGARGPVEVRVDRVTHLVIADDIPEPAQEEGAIDVTYDMLGDLVHRIVAIGQQSTDMLKRIRELKQVNMRLRDMMDVASQRFTQSQHRELRVQRELRQIWRFRFYDRMRIATLEACARRHLGYRRLCHELGRTYEAGDINVLSKKRGSKDRDRAIELGLRGNDLTAYTKRFQELVLLCTRIVLNEEDEVERFVGGLPNNIQGNIMAIEPTKLQDAIRIANNLMDQKLKGYARRAETKGGSRITQEIIMDNN
nr:reverse transcriptase domain-containing protein [Tanacetum cinerariifolium]